MNTLKLTLILLFAIGSISCKSNLKKHEEAAKVFVNALNYDLNYNVKKVKTRTRYKDYIVVYSEDNKDYTAYRIDGYNPETMSIEDYLEENNKDFFYNLEKKVDYWTEYKTKTTTTYDEDGNSHTNTYTYPVQKKATRYYHESGIKFSKSKMTASDLVKAEEIIGALKVEEATNQLIVQFGLPLWRAKDIASLSLQLNNADKSRMTTYKYDQYSKSILGSTYTELNDAIEDQLSGNNNSIEKIYTKAAKTNGITKKSVKQLAELFIKN